MISNKCVENESMNNYKKKKHFDKIQHKFLIKTTNQLFLEFLS